MLPARGQGWRVTSALRGLLAPERGVDLGERPAGEGGLLAQLGEVTDSCSAQGLKPPDPAILAKFLEQQKAESGDTRDGGTDLSKLPVCQLPQKAVPAGASCDTDAEKVWCYVENGATASPAGRCPQALIFSGATGALAGAKFSLQCIQLYDAGGAAGDPTAK